MAIGEDSYTSVFNKIRYLIACTDCDREDIRKLEKNLKDIQNNITMVKLTKKS